MDYIQLLMIGRAGHWTRTPSTTCLQPRNEMLIFGLHLTSDDQPGWSIDSNPIFHLFPRIKWNAHFCITFNLWWSARLVNGLEPHLPSLSTQKKWYAHFCITFKFWSLAGLVNGLEPHLQPLPSEKSEMLIFGLRSTSDDWRGWSMDSNPICHLSPGIKWNAHFCIMFNLWWSARLVNGLKPHLPPLSSQNNEMLIFGLCWTSDSWLGWPMDSNPIHHLSPAKEWNAHFWITFNFWWSAGLVDGLKPHLPPLSTHKMKCSFLHYVQLVMIGQGGQWTQTPSATLLQPKKWNAHFWITFNFWWSAGLVDGLKPHPPPFSNQNNEMLIFGLCWASDSWLGWSIYSNPIHHLSPAKKWNAHFWITFYFWWLARLVNGLKPHLQPLSNQKNEMLIFVLCSNSGDQLSWSIDSNPICHPSPTKKWNACFCITLYFWWSAGLVDGLKAHPPPLKPKKWNANFCITFNFWWSARLVNKLELHPLPFSSQKNEMLIFVLHSTSDDWPGWSLESNPIHLLPQAKKNEMLIFGLCLTSDDQTGWLMNLNPICHPSPAKKMKCLLLYYVIVQIISRAGRWTQSHPPPSSQKMKC